MSDDPASLNPHTLKPPLAAIALGDVPDGGAIALNLAFKAGRDSVIVARRGEVLAAFLNRCPHARWPLDTFDGRFLFTPEGDLMCAAHSAIFDPMSGKCLGGPGAGVGLTAVALVANGASFDICD
jgi:nitrite reductase/ring-hydroxylating ferredoxin subunit